MLPRNEAKLRGLPSGPARSKSPPMSRRPDMRSFMSVAASAAAGGAGGGDAHANRPAHAAAQANAATLRAKPELGPRGGRDELVRHRFAQGAHDPGPGTMQRDDDVRIELAQLGHDLAQVRVIRG